MRAINIDRLRRPIDCRQILCLSACHRRHEKRNYHRERVQQLSITAREKRRAKGGREYNILRRIKTPFCTLTFRRFNGSVRSLRNRLKLENHVQESKPLDGKAFGTVTLVITPIAFSDFSKRNMETVGFRLSCVSSASDTPETIAANHIWGV